MSLRGEVAQLCHPEEESLTGKSPWVTDVRQAASKAGILKDSFKMLIASSPVQRWKKKTYECASNAHVDFFLAWVKSVPKVTLFCHKNQLYHAFAL